MDEMLILLNGLTVGEVTANLDTLLRWVHEGRYGQFGQEFGAEAFCEDFEEVFSDD